MADGAKSPGDGQSPLHVLIIGAGECCRHVHSSNGLTLVLTASAGLTIAQGLKKARQTVLLLSNGLGQ
jgi:hypothetical protein